MAQPVYSVELFAGTISTLSAFEALWTVPAGYVDVIRSIDGYPPSGDAIVAYIGTEAVTWCQVETTTDVQAFQWRGHQIQNAGDDVVAYVLNHPIVLKISGYRLTA